MVKEQWPQSQAEARARPCASIYEWFTENKGHLRAKRGQEDLRAIVKLTPKSWGEEGGGEIKGRVSQCKTTATAGCQRGKKPSKSSSSISSS